MKLDQIEKPMARRLVPLWLACFVAIIPLLLFLPITHDAIWQIWIGREMLHGAGLYTDIIEVNPPLWFWMAVPLAAIGEALGIGARLLIIGFFAASIGLSLFLSPARYRLLLLAALVFLPLQDFGQREHFTLIATAPYVFLIAARIDGSEVRHPLLISLFAALGFALKPYFAIVPLALELLIWTRPRVRPETLALAISAALYVAAIWLFTPAFFTDIVPMVRRAYDLFGGSSTLDLLLPPFVVAALGVALGRRTGCGVTRALVVASLAFLAVVLIQNKGWAYHSIPARGFLFLAVMIELAARRTIIADALLASAALMCFWPIGLYHNRFRAEVEQHLTGVPPHASIAVLSTNPMMAWPMIDERKLDWPLSQMSLWQLNAVALVGQSDAELRQRVARDLSGHPDILIIDRRPIVARSVASVVPKDYLENYRLKATTGNMASYALKTEGQ